MVKCGMSWLYPDLIGWTIHMPRCSLCSSNMDHLSALYGVPARLENACDAGWAVREQNVGLQSMISVMICCWAWVRTYVCVFLFMRVCLHKSPVASDDFTQNTVSYENMYIFPYDTKLKKLLLVFYSFGLSTENRKMVRFPPILFRSHF